MAKVQYVDNVRLTQLCAEWSTTFKAYRAIPPAEQPKQRPKMCNELGGMILIIAQRYGRRPNFSNYTYLEEMISIAITDVIKYLHNFDATKYNNAFSYITTIVHRTFTRTIRAEKKAQDLKYQLFDHANAHGLFGPQDTVEDRGGSVQDSFLNYLQISKHDVDRISKRKSPGEIKLPPNALDI